MSTEPTEAADAVIWNLALDTLADLSFWNRTILLFGGVLHVRAETETATKVVLFGNNPTTYLVYVAPPPWWPRRRAVVSASPLQTNHPQE